MTSFVNPVGIPAKLENVTAEWLTQIMQARYPGIVVQEMEAVFLRNSHTTKYQVKLTLNDVGKAAGIPAKARASVGWKPGFTKIFAASSPSPRPAPSSRRGIRAMIAARDWS